MSPTPYPDKSKGTAKVHRDAPATDAARQDDEQKQHDSAPGGTLDTAPRPRSERSDVAAGNLSARHAIFPVPSPPENLPSATDLALLQAVSRQPKASTGVLAEQVGVKANEVRDRLARLFADGSLLGIRAIVKPFELPIDSLKMICHIRLTSRLNSVRQKFTATVHDKHEIVRCFEVSADFDYLLQIVVPDMPSFRALISELPYIEHLKVVSVLNESS